MERFIPFLILATLMIGLDIYTYLCMRQIMGVGRWSKLFPLIYMSISVIGYSAMLYLFFNLRGGPFSTRTPMINYMIGIVFTLFITKMVFTALMFAQDFGRFILGLFSYAKSQISDEYRPDQHIPDRRQFLTTAANIIAGIPFISLIYGITRGKYAYTVERVSLTFKDLPKAFDGFKIVQISDIHAGSFDSPDSVREGIKMINDLSADIVCFTGDLVNSEKEEIDPYIDIFGHIHSKYGKFAVLGNHDYYGKDAREGGEKEIKYFEDFFKKYKSMGFDLLNNTYRKISIDDQSINIVGVENWGKGPWFPKKGDLDLATMDMPKDSFNVLMSHDPTHWDEKVLAYDKHMHLTMSGHTHGFQFGIKVAGFEWSPAKYRYPRWMGLYEKANKYLYVNRGFGFLGFPGRVGMWPEITLIELKSA